MLSTLEGCNTQAMGKDKYLKISRGLIECVDVLEGDDTKVQLKELN